MQFGLKSYTWFQNQSVQREFDLKSQVWFQTKIAQHKVQLPLYYIHFEIAPIQDLVSSNILLMQYWAGLRLNSSIFFGEKKEVWKQKLQNLSHDTLCLSFPAIWFGLLKTSLEIWLVAMFLVWPANWLGKRWDLKQKMVWFMNKLHQLEPIRLQGPPVISKWV